MWLTAAIIAALPAVSEAQMSYIFYGDLWADENGATGYSFASVPYGWVLGSSLVLRRDGEEVANGYGQSYYMGQSVSLFTSSGCGWPWGCPGPYTPYEIEGNFAGEVPDYGWFLDWFTEHESTPGPVVTVDSASLPDNSIVVTLRPTGGYGQLTITLDGGHLVYQGPAGGGTWTYGFDIPGLPNGIEFTTVEANWEPSGFSTSGVRPYHFKVLGDYNNTRYNTPTESYCSGGLLDIGYVTGTCRRVNNCNFATFQGREGWWVEVLENGSGYSDTLGPVSREWVCSGPPRRARDVPAPCPQCAGMNLGVDASVAVMPNHPDLACGNNVFIHEVGTRKVVDKGGGLAVEQLDHYAGASGCNREGGSIGVRKVIKLF
jgi:hypothetical protein